MAPTYPNLNQIKDPVLRKTFKLLMDQLGLLHTQAGGIGTVSAPLSAPLDSANHLLKTLADPIDAQDAVNLRTLRQYVDGAIKLAANPPTSAVPATSPAGTGTGTGGSGTSGIVCYTDLILGQPLGVPAAPNKRWWRGDFCGVTVPGLPAVLGGAADPTTVFSPHLDRYSAADQARIFAAHTANGYTHFVLSWPNSRSEMGYTIAQFVALAQLVQANGFFPVIFLFSKDFDPVNPAPASIDAVVAALLAGGCMPIACVGWELNLFNDPGAPLQALIDHVTGLLAATANVYVHFSQGITSWQAPGDLGGVFWTANVGKLTGMLHQKELSQDCGLYQAKLNDVQIRFAGQNGYPADSGFGHPFDVVAWETSASVRFVGSIAEAQAQTIGLQAICSPVQRAGQPLGVPVYGYGNGGPAV